MTQLLNLVPYEVRINAINLSSGKKISNILYFKDFVDHGGGYAAPIPGVGNADTDLEAGVFIQWATGGGSVISAISDEYQLVSTRVRAITGRGWRTPVIVIAGIAASLVDTHVDVQQHRGASTSADYGAASDNASAYPGVDRHADPLVLQGLVREVDGVPVVWLPQIPVDPGTGSGAGADLVVCTRSLAYGAVYGYITELGRREQLPVGRTGVNDAYRYSTIVLEEEV